MSYDCGCVGGSSSVDSVSAARESAGQQKIGIALQAVSLQMTKDVGAAMISLIDAASQIGKEIGSTRYSGGRSLSKSSLHLRCRETSMRNKDSSLSTLISTSK